MKDKRLFPVMYMFIVTAILSAAVIGFSQYTQELVQANQRLSFEVAVLKVLPGIYEPGLSSIELHNRFTEQLDEPTEQSAGAYILRKNANLVAYALPIEGQGFWAPIRAVVGIEPDMQTIIGLAIYEQRETPGLGAEVAKEEFTNQFENLKLSLEGKPISFMRPGDKLLSGQIHAVTGATQTSTRLEKIINDSISKWRQEIKGQ